MYYQKEILVMKIERCYLVEKLLPSDIEKVFQKLNNIGMSDFSQKYREKISDLLKLNDPKNRLETIMRDMYRRARTLELLQNTYNRSQNRNPATRQKIDQGKRTLRSKFSQLDKLENQIKAEEEKEKEKAGQEAEKEKQKQAAEKDQHLSNAVKFRLEYEKLKTPEEKKDLVLKLFDGSLGGELAKCKNDNVKTYLEKISPKQVEQFVQSFSITNLTDTEHPFLKILENNTVEANDVNFVSLYNICSELLKSDTAEAFKSNPNLAILNEPKLYTGKEVNSNRYDSLKASIVKYYLKNPDKQRMTLTAVRNEMVQKFLDMYNPEDKNSTRGKYRNNPLQGNSQNERNTTFNQVKNLLPRLTDNEKKDIVKALT